MNKQYLVTGVAGFIGSHIAEELLKSGKKVVGVDNFYSGNKENIELLNQLAKENKTEFNFFNVDISDLEKLKIVFQKSNINYIFHLAAVASVQKSVENPIFTNKVNVQGTLNILELARKFKIKRVVFSSSAAVYGDEPTLPKNENSKPQPISPYGYEKLIGEHYMDIYNKLYGIETVSLRYFNVYGERQDPSSEYSGVISIFEDKLSKGQSAKIYGDGKQFRDFIYVKDIVKINFIAMEKKEAVGEVFACGTGSTVTILELFEKIANKYNYPNIKPIFAPPRNGDIRKSVSDNTKIKNLLGFLDFTDFNNGIMKIHS